MTDKEFFSIKEVASMLDLKPYILRYWEKEFAILKPKRNRVGRRYYSKKDIDMVRLIRNILYEQGYTIAGAKKKLVTKGPVFNINLPIIREGQLRYILSYGRHADDLLAIMRGQRVGSDWVRTIIDRKGVILARSRDHDHVVGTAPEVFAEDLTVADHSIRRTTNLDGEAVLRALARCAVSDWLVTVNVPLAMADASLKWSAMFWGLTAAAAVLRSCIR